MHTRGSASTRSVLQLGLSSLIGLLLTAGWATNARAQEIEPYDFAPLPAGTNLAIGYYSYAHLTDYNIAGGPTIKGSGNEVNVGVGRYTHILSIGGYLGGYQIIQPFGSLSAAHIDDERLGSTFGAQNLVLSAFIWPYINTASKTDINLTGFVRPPTGSYDRRSPINLGDNRWSGDAQIGLYQGVTENFSFDLSFDTQFYGGNSDYVPGNRRLSQDPTYRAQVWANWRWSPAFTTSVGYEGFFGGKQYVDSSFSGNKTEEQRFRVNAALFLTPRLQTMVELNHDLHVVGGFKQDFGTTLRIVYAF